jgi:hypothetical protein
MMPPKIMDFAENVKGDAKSNEKSDQEWRSGLFKND